MHHLAPPVVHIHFGARVLRPQSLDFPRVVFSVPVGCECLGWTNVEDVDVDGVVVGTPVEVTRHHKLPDVRRSVEGLAEHAWCDPRGLVSDHFDLVGRRPRKTECVVASQNVHLDTFSRLNGLNVGMVDGHRHTPNADVDGTPVFVGSDHEHVVGVLVQFERLQCPGIAERHQLRSCLVHGCVAQVERVGFVQFGHHFPFALRALDGRRQWLLGVRKLAKQRGVQMQRLNLGRHKRCCWNRCDIGAHAVPRVVGFDQLHRQGNQAVHRRCGALDFREGAQRVTVILDVQHLNLCDVQGVLNRLCAVQVEGRIQSDQGVEPSTKLNHRFTGGALGMGSSHAP